MRRKSPRNPTCTMHEWRLLRHGSIPQHMRPIVLELLMEHVTVNDKNGCWEWATKNRGYFWAYGEQLASRIMWRIVNRGAPIPKKICVCHQCDNPKCVNPQHLFLGTKRDNSLDMVAKGRHARGKSNARRSIAALDADTGDTVIELPSIAEALRWLGKAPETGAHTNIMFVLKGINGRKSAYGYGWKYLDHQVSYGFRQCTSCGLDFEAWNYKRNCCYGCYPGAGAEAGR